MSLKQNYKFKLNNMTNKQLLKELKELETLIETKEEPDGKRYTCFTDKALCIGEYQSKDKPYYAELLFNIVHNANVSIDYAYQWLEYTIMCLIDVVSYPLEPKEKANKDTILENLSNQELIDSVYTSDHTDFIRRNSWAVDEVVAEWGIKDNIVASAYYKACEETVTQFAYEILEFVLD